MRYARPRDPEVHLATGARVSHAATLAGPRRHGGRAGRRPGGTVTGTWELDGEQVRIAWFEEAGRPPRKTLKEEVGRLAAMLGHDVREEITLA
jgi:hypothetical protein